MPLLIPEKIYQNGVNEGNAVNSNFYGHEAPDTGLFGPSMHDVEAHRGIGPKKWKNETPVNPRAFRAFNVFLPSVSFWKPEIEPNHTFVTLEIFGMAAPSLEIGFPLLNRIRGPLTIFNLVETTPRAEEFSTLLPTFQNPKNQKEYVHFPLVDFENRDTQQILDLCFEVVRKSHLIGLLNLEWIREVIQDRAHTAGFDLNLELLKLIPKHKPLPKFGFYCAWGRGRTGVVIASLLMISNFMRSIILGSSLSDFENYYNSVKTNRIPKILVDYVFWKRNTTPGVAWAIHEQRLKIKRNNVSGKSIYICEKSSDIEILEKIELVLLEMFMVWIKRIPMELKSFV